MDAFDTLEKVEKLFKGKKISGSDPIYLVALKDSYKQSGEGSGMMFPYSALLMCFTTSGVGFFHLNQNSFSIKPDYTKYELNKNSYTFISNEDIKKIKVKKYSWLKRKRKKLKIKLYSDKKYYLFIDKTDIISYQNEGIEALINRLENIEDIKEYAQIKERNIDEDIEKEPVTEIDLNNDFIDTNESTSDITKEEAELIVEAEVNVSDDLNIESAEEKVVVNKPTPKKSPAKKVATAKKTTKTTTTKKTTATKKTTTAKKSSTSKKTTTKKKTATN